jgi:hypothetical protein
MSKLRNGWRSAAARRGRPPAELPNVPSQFDTLLSSMGISEADAASNEFMRFWIRQHAHNRFVPEAILEAVVGRQY